MGSRISVIGNYKLLMGTNLCKVSQTGGLYFENTGASHGLPISSQVSEKNVLRTSLLKRKTQAQHDVTSVRPCHQTRA